MRLSEHMKNTFRDVGVEARDIHEWIDAFFDHERFQKFLRTGFPGDYNPYDHRVHRHCREALLECLEAFKETYSEDVVKAVFEHHVRADYEGYFPSRKDFEDWLFHEKYHTK